MNIYYPKFDLLNVLAGVNSSEPGKSLTKIFAGKYFSNKINTVIIFKNIHLRKYQCVILKPPLP